MNASSFLLKTSGKSIAKDILSPSAPDGVRSSPTAIPSSDQDTALSALEIAPNYLPGA